MAYNVVVVKKIKGGKIMVHLKFDGKYVKESDHEYLDECEKEESVFSEATAESIKKECPDRVELEEIKWNGMLD